MMSKFGDNNVFIKYKRLGIKVSIRTAKYLDFGESEHGTFARHSTRECHFQEP